MYDISPPLDNTDHSVADFETALLEMQVDEFSYANSEEEDDDDDNAASESDENATNTGQVGAHGIESTNACAEPDIRPN